MKRDKKKRINDKLHTRREVGYAYKIWTIIFGVCTILFGVTSIILTIYSIQLQRKETESRQILSSLKDILTTMSDTTSVLQVKTAINNIKNNIPDNYKYYVRSVGSLADSLEHYNKYLLGYEKRIIESLLPAEMMRNKKQFKGWAQERALYFEIIYPNDTIRFSDSSKNYIVIKFLIPVDEVYCIEIQLSSEKYLVATYDYFPRGNYNKLSIPDLDKINPVKGEVGIFLKQDTTSIYPSFYRKELFFKKQ